MSHFTVAVFTKVGTEEDVARLLAPFEEREDWFEEGSRWDWWVIGGRWDGAIRGLVPIDDGRGGFNFGDKFHTLERNACAVPDMAPDYMPFAFVTPDGMWTERGRMGWWAQVDNEKEQEEWQQQWSTAKATFTDCIVVQVDCHV